MTEYNINRGTSAENHFAAMLNRTGIPHRYADDWYDFDVNAKNGTIKVEVKSCCISRKDLARKWRIGRFDFTSKENKRLQFEHNVWICLVIRVAEQYVIWGFVEAKHITQARYLTIHKAMELKMRTIEQWLKEVNV